MSSSNVLHVLNVFPRDFFDYCHLMISLLSHWGYPGVSDSKESACSARELGSIPGSGRCSREGNGNPLKFSCLENSMDRGAWWAIVHWVSRVRHDWATNIFTSLSYYPIDYSFLRILWSLLCIVSFCSRKKILKRERLILKNTKIN